MANRTQVYRFTTWVKETLLSSKARGVITKNITELSKTSNNIDIRWGRCPYVATYCLDKIMDIASAVVQDTSPTGNKVLDRDSYWSVDFEFCFILVIENWKSLW